MADSAEASSSGKTKYLKVNDWILGDVIGTGNDAIVRLAVNQEKNMKAAVKVISTNTLALKEGKKKKEVRARIKREIDILRCLHHPHIVSLYDALWNGDDVYVIMEYVGGGELINYIDDSGVNEEDAKLVFWQILSAVHYCHLRKIVHRDLKLENLLVDGKTNEVKITDFGFANMLKSNQKKFETICGTLLYLAPEIFLGQTYSGPPVDIWSLGVILFSMLAGRFPFGDTENLPQHVIAGQYTVPDFVSKPATKLLKRMLCPHPKKRATFKDIIKSEWLKQTVKDNINLMPAEPDSTELESPEAIKAHERLQSAKEGEKGAEKGDASVAGKKEKEKRKKRDGDKETISASGEEPSSPQSEHSDGSVKKSKKKDREKKSSDKPRKEAKEKKSKK